MYCTNEFLFRNNFIEIETLKLNGGFIAHSRLVEKFPNVRVIQVLGGGLMIQQCHALNKKLYEVQGCKTGYCLFFYEA